MKATDDLLKLYPHQEGEMREEKLSVEMKDKEYDLFSQFEVNRNDMYSMFKLIRTIANENFSQFEKDMKTYFGAKVTYNNKLDKSRGSVGLKRVTEKFCEDQFMQEL